MAAAGCCAAGALAMPSAARATRVGRLRGVVRTADASSRRGRAGRAARSGAGVREGTATGAVSPSTMATSGATWESARCGTIIEVSAAAVCGALMSGGSMKATNLRVTFDVQPTETLTVTTGSSTIVLVVTRTMRSLALAVASSVTRTCPGCSLLSPTSTSAATHSRDKVSSFSRRIAAAKLSGWPSWVVLPMRPKPRALAGAAATQSATARLSEKTVAEARMQGCEFGVKMGVKATH